MKILHFFKTYWPDTNGGIEHTISNIADGLKRHDVQTTVLTLSPNPAGQALERNGHRIVQLKRNFEIASSGFSFGAPTKLRELAQQHDVIHYHCPWPFMDIAHALSHHKKPSLVTYHADPIGNPILATAYAPLLHRFLSSVDKIVATSPNYINSSKFLKRQINKVDVVPIGIAEHPDANNDKAKNEEIKSKYGDEFFLFIGVLRHYKGLKFLLEAARNTKATILIAGDGVRRAELEKIKMERNLDNVHFLGFVDEATKGALLSNCRAFVFPSHTRAEAFGLSLVEAARAGKPMISCELGTGTSFVNIGDETGIVVAPENPDALAQAINNLLENRALAKRLGSNAKARFAKHMTQKKMSDRYFALYQELAAIR